MAANKGADATIPSNHASFDTMVVHAGREIDAPTGAVAPRCTCRAPTPEAPKAS